MSTLKMTTWQSYYPTLKDNTAVLFRDVRINNSAHRMIAIRVFLPSFIVSDNLSDNKFVHDLMPLSLHEYQIIWQEY